MGDMQNLYVCIMCNMKGKPARDLNLDGAWESRKGSDGTARVVFSFLLL